VETKLTTRYLTDKYLANFWWVSTL